MAAKQTLICPQCNASFEYDPNSNESVIMDINESREWLNDTGPSTSTQSENRESSDREVNAYLECPNGHLLRYQVTKSYK